MTLSEVCEFIVDCPHSTAPDEGKGYPLIRTPNVGRGRLLLDGVHRVSHEVYDKRNARAVPQDNDLIFAREAPVGNVAIIKNGEKVCLGQRTVLLRPNARKVDPDFLVYYLLAPEKQYALLSTANGATVTHLNLPIIRDLPISLPSLTRQKRIGAILSRYDALIENYRTQIRLLEEAAERIYREWFVHFRFPGWKKARFTGDGVPEGWERVPLSDVISLNPKVSCSVKSLYSVPMEALSNTSMVIDETKLQIARGNGGAKFQNGDTLLARITPCLENGKTGFVMLLADDEYMNGSTEFIVMRSKCQTPHMVYLHARTDGFRSYAINTMTGADGRQRAQADMIGSMAVVDPPCSLKRQFEQLVTPMFDVIRARVEAAKNLQEARDRLLPKLMSGKA